MGEAGRPNELDKAQSVTLNVNGEDYRLFKEICAREGVSMSSKLREWIKLYIKEHGSGNPNYSLELFTEERPPSEPQMQAVPAFLAQKEPWVKHILAETKLEDIEQLEQQAQFIAKVAKTRKRTIIGETARKLRGLRH